MPWIVYKDSIYESHRALWVPVDSRSKYEPCIEYPSESEASWAAKHLDSSCGRVRNGCPFCIAQSREKKEKKRELEKSSDGQANLS